MIWPFKKRFAPSDNVYAVYDAIVAQSRQEMFYTDLSVPDTVTGRFDMICLHMGMVLHRIRGEQRAFSQELFDLFFKDMDRSLREMGVGDVSVPKRITKMGSVFYGLLEKMTEVLDGDEQGGLAILLQRNIGGAEQLENAERLAQYLQNLRARLAAQSSDAIASGHIDMKEPL